MQLVRWFAVGQPTITRALAFALVLSVASLMFLFYYVSTVDQRGGVPRAPPQPTIRCRMNDERQSDSPTNDHTSSARLRLDNKVLVLVETQFSRNGQKIIMLLEANRIKFKVELAKKSLPFLTRSDKGKYGVIIFENLDSYVTMDKWNRQLLDKYEL